MYTCGLRTGDAQALTIDDVDSRVYESWGSKQIKHNVGVIYRGTARGTPAVTEAEGSTEEVAWWTFAEAAELPLTRIAGDVLSNVLPESAEG